MTRSKDQGLSFLTQNNGFPHQGSWVTVIVREHLPEATPVAKGGELIISCAELGARKYSGLKRFLTRFQTGNKGKTEVVHFRF